MPFCNLFMGRPSYYDWHIYRQSWAQPSCLLCLHWRYECTCFSVKTSTIKLTPDVSWCDRVDPDSSLHTDMQLMREKEGFDHILFNFTFKVSCTVYPCMSVCQRMLYCHLLPRCDYTSSHYRSATVGIAITQQAILRFFAPLGWHDSRISMKFGTAERTPRRPKFHTNPAKKREKLPQFPTFSPRRVNSLPDFDEICKIYAGNGSTKAINIFCDRLVH